METPEGKVSLLDAIPVRCDHILTEWEGDYAVISYPRFKYEWMRRLLLPKSMSPDIHVRLEEDRKSTRLNSSHSGQSRMPSSA